MQINAPESQGPGASHKRNNTSSTFVSKDKRWSDVVPPNTALTFAVIWDPEDGMVAFSGADFLDNTTPPLDSPTDIGDQYSQISTPGSGVGTGRNVRPGILRLAEKSATLSIFHEYNDFPFKSSNVEQRYVLERTRVSSTLDGLDVYLRGSLFATTHLRGRQYSFLGELSDDFNFDPRTSFALKWMEDSGIQDERHFFVDGGRYQELGLGDGVENGWGTGAIQEELNLSSAFSVTTTSTSNYIEVDSDMCDDDDSGSSNWSTLEAPSTPTYARLLFTEQRHTTRRLRKRRPASPSHSGPNSPSDILQRPDYNHIDCDISPSTSPNSSPPNSPKRGKVIPAFIRKIRLGKLKNSSKETH